MSRTRAFTLLEVMVAIAILGLSLTVILSAQAGLYASGASAQKMSIAIGLARCRMAEIEEKLLKYGYPGLDEIDEGACCEDEDRQDVRCSWRIERIELPPVQLTGSLGGGTAGGASPASSALDLLGKLASGPKGGASAGALAGGAGGLGSMGGPLGSLLSLSPSESTLAGDGGLHSIATDISDETGGPAGIAGALAPLVMGFVYPQLKPLLETSIRKITVKTEWKEGIHSRDFSIVQYVARPMLPPPDLGGGTTGGSTSSTPSSAGGFGLPGGGGFPFGGLTNPLTGGK